MMNENEELQRLLYERGVVDWRETMTGNTAWTDANGDEAVVLRSEAGLVQLRAWITPEAAVQATPQDSPSAWPSSRGLLQMKSTIEIGNSVVPVMARKLVAANVSAA